MANDSTHIQTNTSDIVQPHNPTNMLKHKVPSTAVADVAVVQNNSSNDEHDKPLCKPTTPEPATSEDEDDKLSTISGASSSTGSSAAAKKSKKKYKYLCKYSPSCKKIAKAGGLCIGHGGGKRCVLPGCQKVARYAGSLCHIHRELSVNSESTELYLLKQRNRQTPPHLGHAPTSVHAAPLHHHHAATLPNNPPAPIQSSTVPPPLYFTAASANQQAYRGQPATGFARPANTNTGAALAAAQLFASLPANNNMLGNNLFTNPPSAPFVPATSMYMNTTPVTTSSAASASMMINAMAKHLSNQVQLVNPMVSLPQVTNSGRVNMFPMQTQPPMYPMGTGVLDLKKRGNLGQLDQLNKRTKLA